MPHVKPAVAAVLALVFGIAAAAIAATSQSRSATPMKTFTSPNGDFQFQYPGFLIDCKAQTNDQSCGPYMPVCSGTSDDSIACIAYPRTRMSEVELKTFDGAAFVVAVVKDAHEERACRATMDPPPPGWRHPPTEKINGVPFWVTENGSAAMSHGEDQMIYRAFHNNLCYELDINISSVNPMVYDPPRPKMYNQAPVNKALAQTLQSFKFLK